VLPARQGLPVSKNPRDLFDSFLFYQGKIYYPAAPPRSVEVRAQESFTPPADPAQKGSCSISGQGTTMVGEAEAFTPAEFGITFSFPITLE
jgi:hypothetical protein